MADWMDIILKATGEKKNITMLKENTFGKDADWDYLGYVHLYEIVDEGEEYLIISGEVRGCIGNNMFVELIDVSKELSLKIEIFSKDLFYSQDISTHFMEHCIFDCGKICCDEVKSQLEKWGIFSI